MHLDYQSWQTWLIYDSCCLPLQRLEMAGVPVQQLPVCCHCCAVLPVQTSSCCEEWSHRKLVTPCNADLCACTVKVAPMAADTEWVYSSGRRHSRGGRERSLSVSSGGSRRSSINELRLQRTSSSAIASTQPSQ